MSPKLYRDVVGIKRYNKKVSFGELIFCPMSRFRGVSGGMLAISECLFFAPILHFVRIPIPACADGNGDGRGSLLAVCVSIGSG